MTIIVRPMGLQGTDRQTLSTFYLAHAIGHFHQRVEKGGLAFDPRCAHLGALGPDGAPLAVVQWLPTRGLDRADHWLAIFEAHTVPGGAARQWLLFPPVTAGGAAGRQALADLLVEVAARATDDGCDALLLAAAPDDVDTFTGLGFAVYTNGRRSSGTGFAVPMVRLLSPVADAPAPRDWLAGVVARRRQFIVHDVSRSSVAEGLFQRLSLRRAR